MDVFFVGEGAQASDEYNRVKPVSSSYNVGKSLWVEWFQVTVLNHFVGHYFVKHARIGIGLNFTMMCSNPTTTRLMFSNMVCPLNLGTTSAIAHAWLDSNILGHRIEGQEALPQMQWLDICLSSLPCHPHQKIVKYLMTTRTMPDVSVVAQSLDDFCHTQCCLRQLDRPIVLHG